MVDMDVGIVQRDKDEHMFYGSPGFSIPLRSHFLVATLTGNTANLSHSYLL